MRLHCVVPGCNHTRGQRKGESPITDQTEWICAKHWMAVPAHMRRRKSTMYRRYRKHFGDTPFWQFEAGSPDRLHSARLDRACRLAWALCKRAAIERGLGI